MVDRIPDSRQLSAAQISALHGVRFTEGSPSPAIVHTTTKGAAIEGAASKGMTVTIPKIPRGTPQDFMLKVRTPGPLEATGVQAQEQSVVLPPLTGTNVDRRA